MDQCLPFLLATCCFLMVTVLMWLPCFESYSRLTTTAIDGGTKCIALPGLILAPPRCAPHHTITKCPGHANIAGSCNPVAVPDVREATGNCLDGRLVRNFYWNDSRVSAAHENN